jgi:CxxC motif-containing protein (DUF1111 family)
MQYLISITFSMFVFTLSDSFAASSTDQSIDDFSRPEANEHLPGGSATHHKMINQNAFSHASANMSFEREIDFKVGNGFFKRLWVSAPASTQASDGLGPLYNARSCQRCHIKDGRGHPPNGAEDNAVSMFLRLSIPPQTEVDKKRIASHRVNNIPDPVYGTQLQDFAIAGHNAEGAMRIDYKEFSVELSDGESVSLRKPSYTIASLGYGPLHPQIQISPRVAPQMIGLGLLEAISEEEILQQADPQDRDADGISGRANQVWSTQHQRVMLGRFGLKAGAPSVNEQSQGAFHGDIGISVPLHRTGSGECTEAQKACIKAPNGNSPQYDNLEAESRVTDLVVFYAKNLAVPARRDHDSEAVLAGKKIFYDIGCSACHRPKYRTPKTGVAPEQADQLIWPYTDLLLHDMGEGLADHRPEGVANGREWRTAPLWGIGLTPEVNGHSYYLHDGRARNLLEAVLWHGGEAQSARDAVVKLPKQARQSLLRFVESL